MGVDEDKITHLRNAIGHGKILSKSPYPSAMKIFNLKNLDKDHVIIVFFEEMTSDWFESNIVFLKSETVRLKKLYKELIESVKTQ